MLLKILPPKGVEILGWKRPYMIIDPRAGHGAGIGGSKQDSQVGVALADCHPVYFVAFRPHPEPGQTLADVMRAEAADENEIKIRGQRIIYMIHEKVGHLGIFVSSSSRTRAVNARLSLSRVTSSAKESSRFGMKGNGCTGSIAIGVTVAKMQSAK